ncbi:hypothetical protein J6590_061874 [Homalodisca vitripennis]|nr:hypothetical protein J6590_061874 [Homalodisca vitripennis]
MADVRKPVILSHRASRQLGNYKIASIIPPPPAASSRCFAPSHPFVAGRVFCRALIDNLDRTSGSDNNGTKCPGSEWNISVPIWPLRCRRFSCHRQNMKSWDNLISQLGLEAIVRRHTGQRAALLLRALHLLSNKHSAHT